MEITLSGYFFILLGLFAFLFSYWLLYALVVFFVPFTATSVINVIDFGTGSAIQPYMFFAALNIAYIITNFWMGRKLLSATVSSNILLLALFAAISTLSLIMPTYIDGRISGNISGIYGERDPIVFSARNIIQLLYLFVGIGFSLVVFKRNTHKSDIDQTIKIYAYSMIFVLLWGLVQLFCYRFGISYPDYLFNNSANSSIYKNLFINIVDEFSEMLALTSVGAEPSILVQSIVIYVPFLIFGQIYKKYIFSRLIDLIMIGGLFVFCIYTGSATGAISFLAVIFASIILFLINNAKSNPVAVLKVTLITFSSVLILVMIFFEKFELILFNKIDSYSALERADTIISSWESFVLYPLLGVGLGSVSSGTMALKILSSTGVLGGLVFFLLLTRIFRDLINSRRQELKSSTHPYYSDSMLISLFAMLLAATFAGFSFVFGSYWFVIGLALAISKVFEKKI